MQPFQLTLSNGGTLTGLHHCPDPASPGYRAIDDSERPLLVAIHGSSYSASYFDADATRSAVPWSTALGVPVVAIDRPLYQGTSSFYPLPAGTTYHEQLALWLHRYILPAVWHEFGRGRGCSSVVLHCHSLAVPSAVLAAGRVAAEAARGEVPAYPLAGMTVSGLGSQLTPALAALHAARTTTTTTPPPPPPTDQVPAFAPRHAAKAKDDRMIQAGTVDPAVYALTEQLDNPMPYAEVHQYGQIWFPDGWRKLCGAVAVPVLIGMAEHDRLWMGTEEHVREFAGGFTGAERVDASVVKGAPHCIELSYVGQEWYARNFRWALECAAAFAAKKRRVDDT